MTAQEVSRAVKIIFTCNKIVHVQQKHYLADTGAFPFSFN